MEAFVDHERIILCPYNKSHEIRVSRMQTHLTKCRKNYPDSPLKQCDFNLTHLIPEPELQYHHEYCPDRKKVELEIYEEEGIDVNKFPVHNVAVPTEESWDDFNVPAYNPQTNIQNRPILREVKVEAPSKKKSFRMEERKRINELMTEQCKISHSNERQREPERLPNRATSTVLIENDPAIVEALRERVKKPQMPIIPGRSKDTTEQV